MTLVIKVWSNNKNIEVLRKILEVFKEKYKDKFDEKLFLKPNKFFRGTWMTQLLINDYIVLNEDNTISIEKTLEKIREYQIMLKSLEKEFGDVMK